MKMKSYYWSGITKDERIKAINEITIIDDRFATIINFQRFSDISLSLILEVEEYRLNEMQTSLKNIMSVEGLVTEPTDSKTTCIVLFHITFTKGTGDFRIEVPDIPD